MTSQLFLLFRSQVVSNSSRPHGQQPARLPSPSPGPCPSSRPLNRCTLLLNFSSLSQEMKIAALSRGDWEDCRRPVRQSYTAWHTGVPGTQEASAAVLHCLAHRSAWYTGVPGTQQALGCSYSHNSFLRRRSALWALRLNGSPLTWILKTRIQGRELPLRQTQKSQTGASH